MRKIIENARGFEDKETHDFIKCAFSLDKICKPECAACTILNETRDDLLNIAQCRRNGSDNAFSVGFVIKDK